MTSIYIQGIAGTFMGGLAQLAREEGFTVLGSDQGVYPPMSSLLDALGIEYFDSFDPANLDAIGDAPVVVGNVMTRGMDEIEALLDRRLAYLSGPRWLGENILRQRAVLAVAGTHGKTTTSSIAAYLLDAIGLEPGFLIGGVPGNFDVSARRGKDWFVIEADEYDSAFFDKRSKFVHYRPSIAVLNNLEFDHGDIFDTLADIEKQFHHLVRTIPQSGTIIARYGDAAIERALAKGCWTPVEYFGLFDEGKDIDWRVKVDTDSYSFYHQDALIGKIASAVLPGQFNALNALAAIAACAACGAMPEELVAALAGFKLPKRRLQRLLEKDELIIYEDFAHHPTAIRGTLNALKAMYPAKKVVACLEKASNSMRAGMHDQSLDEALTQADEIYILDRTSQPHAHQYDDGEALISELQRRYHDGDFNNACIVFMSNRAFDRIPSRFCESVSLQSQQ